MKRSTGTPVNLLPLLDVLLCTMGTLIVVLGVLNRLARTHGDNDRKEQAAIAREQISLHIEQLTAVREKTLADLENARRRLSGIEEHSRELADKLHSLQVAADQLPTEKTADDTRNALRQQLLQLNVQRTKLNQDLKAARDGAFQKKVVFSIVPFDGLYKTNRRPIYIECRSDVIILQPEGIVFTPADFLGPGGPGNPLASALRAAQEYWREIPPPAPDVPNEPYPLLIVRPDGIIAYYLARDAMDSWNTEFGYELVSGDAKFEYPTQPEQRLVEMEKRAVAEARQRLQWLAQVSPEAFDRKQQKVQYRVSAIRGGLVRDGGPSLGQDPFADDPLGGFGKSATVGGGVTTDDGTIPGGGMARGSGIGSGGAGAGGGMVGAVGNSLASTRGNSALGAGTGAGGLENGGFSGNGLGTGGPGGHILSGDNGRGGDLVGTNGNGDNGTSSPESGPALGTGGAGPETGAGGSSTIAGNGGASGGAGFKNGGAGYMTGAANQGQEGYSPAGGQLGQQSPLGPRYSQSGSGQFGGAQSGGVLSGNNLAGSSQPSGKPEGANAGGSGSESGQGNFAASSQGNRAGMYGRSGSASAESMSGGNSTFGNSYASSGGSLSGDNSTSGGGPGSSGIPGGESSAESGSANQSGGQSGGSGDPSAFSSGTPSPSINYNANDQQSNRSRKLANERGRNWAVQNNTNSSVPITRPIRIECWKDRLVMLPDNAQQQPQTIPFSARTDEAVDQLVAAVRMHTQGWGLAGRSMYWKPQLVLEVQPEAESRASDLQTMLAESGLDVKRK